MKIKMKKPAGCGGLRRGQFVCVEIEEPRGLRQKYYSVSNLKVALALWLLGEREGVLRVRKKGAREQ